MHIIKFFLGNKYSEVGSEYKKTKAFVVLHLVVVLLLIFYIGKMTSAGKMPIFSITSFILLVLIFDLILIRKGKVSFVGKFFSLFFMGIIVFQTIYNPAGVPYFTFFVDTFYTMIIAMLIASLFGNIYILTIDTALAIFTAIYTYRTNLNGYGDLTFFASHGIGVYILTLVIIYIISLLLSRYLHGAIQESEENLKKTEQQTNELSKIITDVQQSAIEMKNISAEINKTSLEISSGANQQITLSSEISTATDQITETIEFTSLEAISASEEARKSVNSITKSNRAVENTVKRLYEIIDKTAYINNFAVKTNILALNAAIEAKHAGVYGAGFAAIAQEIRKLAENSRLAAEEINSLVVEGKNSAEASIQLLTKAIPEIQQTAKTINTITNTGKKQNQKAIQINKTIQKLSKTSIQNNNTAAKLKNNYQQLKQMTEMLNSYVDSDNNKQKES